MGRILIVHFVWKEKWPEIQVYIDLWALANSVAGWSENWKEYHQKVGDEKVWGRNKWVDSSNSVQGAKVLVSQVNDYQMVTLAEEDFINQVDKMTCLVDDTRQLSFSDTLVIFPRHVNQAAVSEGMQVMCGLSIIDFQSLRPIIYRHCWVPNLSTAETIQVLIQFYPQGGIQLPGDRLTILDHSHQGRGGAFCSYWNRHLP